MSKHLNRTQLAAMNKVGDALVPGDGEFPKFSATGCVRDLDRVLDYMPAQDLKDLKMLLSILGFLPAFAVGFVMRSLERVQALPGSVGGLLRLIRLGLRGLVFTLYYSDPRVVALVGYDVSVYLDDREGVRAADVGFRTETATRQAITRP